MNLSGWLLVAKSGAVQAWPTERQRYSTNTVKIQIPYKQKYSIIWIQYNDKYTKIEIQYNHKYSNIQTQIQYKHKYSKIKIEYKHKYSKIQRQIEHTKYSKTLTATHKYNTYEKQGKNTAETQLQQN